MTYYAHINSKEILTDIDMSIMIEDEYGSKDVQNIEVSEAVYNKREQYIYQDGKVIKDPNYDIEQLIKAKTDKYTEALKKAEIFLSNNACYQFDEYNSIEATDGNIGKFTAYALGMQSGLSETVTWTTKEDNVITLDLEDVITILTGLGAVQANVWNVQFIEYKTAIDNAETIEEVEGIEINYGKL